MMHAHSTQHRRIVLVEDDDICSRHVASALRRSFTDLDVRQTKDTAEALSLLADEASRLLITDAQTRQVDGIAVATCARERRPELPVIVLSNPSCSAASLPQLSEAAWLEKPPRTDRLILLVERLLRTPVGFSGAITIEGLPDLVQLLSMTHASGALHVRYAQRHGCMWFDDGAIVDASLDALRGPSAVYEMLSWQGGTFAIERDARPARYTIDQSVTQLLLESMCRQDHARAGGLTEPPKLQGAIASIAREPSPRRDVPRLRTPSQTRLRVPVVPTPPPPAGWTEPAGWAEPGGWTEPGARFRDRAAESFQRGLELVQDKDYVAAKLEWERAIEHDPDNRLYQSNLRRLRELIEKSTMRGQHGDQE